MRHIAQGVHIVDAQQTFYGLEVGARMTLLETSSGILVHSPLAGGPETVLPREPKWVLAPNLFHHLYAKEWTEQGVEGWAAPGLAQKRPDIDFAGTVGEDKIPFGSDLDLFALTSLDMTREVVVLHKPSRTLIVTDLVFNIAQSAPISTRFVMRCLGGYPGCKTSLLERVNFNKTRAKEDITYILDLDFDRVIMAHGEVIESGGKDKVASAFSWLGFGRQA